MSKFVIYPNYNIQKQNISDAVYRADKVLSVYYRCLILYGEGYSKQIVRPWLKVIGDGTLPEGF